MCCFFAHSKEELRHPDDPLPAAYWDAPPVTPVSFQHTAAFSLRIRHQPSDDAYITHHAGPQLLCISNQCAIAAAAASAPADEPPFYASGTPDLLASCHSLHSQEIFSWVSPCTVSTWDSCNVHLQVPLSHATLHPEVNYSAVQARLAALELQRQQAAEQYASPLALTRIASICLRKLVPSNNQSLHIFPARI